MWLFAGMAPSMLREGAGISKFSAAVLACMRLLAAVDAQVNDQGLFLWELLRASREMASIGRAGVDLLMAVQFAASFVDFPAYFASRLCRCSL